MRLGALTLLVVLVFCGPALAQGDAHAHHRASSRTRYATSLAVYDLPPVALEDSEGRAVSLEEVVAGPEPIALNFIFTTCTTICPVMTATFARMNAQLGADAKGLRFVSISIDPEYDTPGVLKSYASRYDAGENWWFLTGGAEEVTSVLRAFDAYFGGKTNHRPLTFLRGPSATEWVRIEGLASGADLATEYRHLLGIE